MKSILFYTNPTHFPATQQTLTTSPQKGKSNSKYSICTSTKWRILKPLNCAVNEPKPSKNGTKVGKGKMGAASLAMACVVGIIGASLKMNFKAIAGPREMYQKAPQMEFGYSLGGRSALKSLLDVNVNLSCDNLEPPNAFYQLPSRPSAEEVQDIKMEAVRLMKYGKAEDAILLLRNAYELYKYDPEPAYNVEMALVEILISQGKYLEASDCNCLKDDQRLPSDARFPLYKAIIYTMLDETEEANKWWDEYVETVEGEFDPTKLT